MTALLSEWWFWLSAAVVLGIVEVLVPAFVFLGFSIGAVAVGLLLATELLTVTPAWTVVLFAVLSLVGYVLLRALLGKTSGDVRVIDRDINDN